MSASGRSFAFQSLAIMAVLGTAMFELAISESFHGDGDQGGRMLVTIGAAVALVLLQRLLDSDCSEARRRIARLPLVAAFCIYQELVIPRVDVGLATVPALQAQGWLVTAAIGALLAFGLSASPWRAVRRAAIAAALLFVLAQPIVIAVRAPHLAWPPVAASTKRGTSDDLQVFVLLDELNANRVSGIVDALRAEHYGVESASIMPTDDGTAKVVPALFTRQSFSQARPCGFSATCSGDHVLDFRRIAAARSDVDVVGFYLPYCEIQGLRWCRRLTVADNALELDRWRCALWRHSGRPADLTPHDCDAVLRRPWNAMAETTLETVFQAPAWQRGGFLYAHVPLPHPPGRLGRASLKANYLDSIDRANAFVREMARRAMTRSGRKVTFVVFSDHPLRQSMWCTSQWIFSSLGCKPVSELEDNRVPLIVASTGSLPAIQDIVNNRQVFDLAAR